MLINGYERSNSIVVLCGGKSLEREVSLDSGRNVVSGLKEIGFNVVSIDPKDKAWIKKLVDINPCYIFNILHGAYGEDGLMQGFLDTMGFCYSGSGVLGSAISMNKAKSKHIWANMDLSTLPFIMVDKMDKAMLEKIKNSFSAPFCLKTVDGGSSIGIKKVLLLADLPRAYAELKSLDSDIICEPWLNDVREYTVGILNGKPLPIIEIISGVDFYDFDAKYRRGDTQYICPCDMESSIQKELQRIAVAAFNAIGCKHYGRVDFICDKEGEFYLLEVNTVPGFTRKSLVPMAADHHGYSFNELLLELLPKETKDFLIDGTKVYS